MIGVSKQLWKKFQVSTNIHLMDLSYERLAMKCQGLKMQTTSGQFVHNKDTQQDEHLVAL